MTARDLYCEVCGLPFRPFHDTDHDQETAWLTRATFKHGTGQLDLRSLEHDGEFLVVHGKIPAWLKKHVTKESGGAKVLYISQASHRRGSLLHAACAKRTDTLVAKLANTMYVRPYQQRWFDVDGFLKDKKVRFLMAEPDGAARRSIEDMTMKELRSVCGVMQINASANTKKGLIGNIREFVCG